MDTAVIAETAAQILHARAPRKLVKQAESLYLQSSTSIPLKSNVEPARIYVCCVLAVETLASQLDLPEPDTQKPPVPPAAYQRLLDQFRQTLLGVAPAQAQGLHSIRSVSGLGGRHPTRAARRPIVGPASASSSAGSRAQSTSPGGSDESDANADGSASDAAVDAGSLSDSGDDYDDSDAGGGGGSGSGRRAGAYLSRAHKRAAAATAPSARNTTPRKRTKSAVPTPKAVDEIGALMGLGAETVDAVRHAFMQYRDLVKDAWGLVYGLFAVISERAEPRMGMENLNRLDRALRDVAPPRLYIDPNEWIPWVERIVTGQTWIMKISKRPEPAAKLVGAPGGWGLGVEYTLVDP